MRTLFFVFSLLFLVPSFASAQGNVIGGYSLNAEINGKNVVCNSVFMDSSRAVCRIKESSDWPFEGQQIEFTTKAYAMFQRDYTYGKIDMRCESEDGSQIFICGPAHYMGIY
jgi:hypothetical protein